MNRAIGKNSQVLQILAREIQELISQEEIDMEGLQEIRLRVGSPVILNIRGKERDLQSGNGNRILSRRQKCARR